MTSTLISAKIVQDSVSAGSGARLVTMEWTYPLFIHNEIMTHRMFSRNAASSRAIPVKKMIERVLTDPAMPVSWREHQAGMQPKGLLPYEAAVKAKYIWLQAMQDAVDRARQMETLGVAKEITNRLLGPFTWMTTLVTASEWGNFFYLRCHQDAQEEFQVLAKLACEAFYASEPEVLQVGEWHLPYITEEDRKQAEIKAGNSPIQDDVDGFLRLISVGRCARVSYLTHTGYRDINEDVKLAGRLKQSGHWSPFEHVAQAMGSNGYSESTPSGWSGNFRGWAQFRKWFAGENQSLIFQQAAEYAERV